MPEKEKSALEKFKEEYPDCLEGYVEDVYVESGIGEEGVSQCSIRQVDVSKPKIALLKTQEDLSIPSIGLTKGHRVSFFAVGGHSNFLVDYDGTLVALLNYNTGRGYDAKIPLKPDIPPLKWENIPEPL